MNVITISGKAQSGKDTTAKLLKEQLEDMGYSVLITHYADLLKYQAKTLFGWNGEKDEVGRSLLQRLGTDIVRKKNENYWVQYVIDMLKMYCDEWDFVIIPDARFENEIIAVKNCFPTIAVRVYSDNYNNGLTDEQKKHPSETALDNFKFDYEILNNSRTMEDLKSRVNLFVQEIVR